MKFRWDKKYLYWGITALLVIIGGISFYYLIFHSKSLFRNLVRILDIAMPIIDGLVLAYLMWPILRFIELRLLYPCKDWLTDRFDGLKGREKTLKKYCRGISILLTLSFVLLLIYGFFQFIIPQLAVSIRNIARQFPTYIRNFSTWLNWILASYPEIEKTVVGLFQTYSLELNQWLNGTLLPQMNTLLRSVSNSMIAIARSLWDLIIGLIISIYLLGNKERFLSQAKKATYALFDTRQANRLVENARLIDATFGGFIIGKLLDSAIIGVICFVVVSLMGMPYPVLLSVIVGITNIIPFFGPFIGAVPCALLILVVNPVQSLYFIIFIFILQQFDGNVLGPKILGNTTGLSGFWVIFSITVFSGFFGVWGMLLGVPTFAVIYTLGKRRVNRNLSRKGMPTDTETYLQLKEVDQKTGDFINLDFKQPGRNGKKTAYWREKIRQALAPRREEFPSGSGSLPTKEADDKTSKEEKP